MSTNPGSSLSHRLDYQLRVNALLLAETRASGGPVLSQDEMNELEEAYDSGEDADDFAKRLIARDLHGQSHAYDLNADNGPSTERDRTAMQDAGRGLRIL